LSDDDAELFRRAMADAKPLKSEQRVPPPDQKAKAKPRKSRKTRVSADSENKFDYSGAEPDESDFSMRFQRPSVGRRTIRKLARGGFRIATEIDLHGMTVAEAGPRLDDFIRASAARQSECVRIIHGKGLGSGERGPVLKRSVNRWLRQMSAVQAFVPARQVDGGDGAVYVLLMS
jgi:DNA-nicking Smr family endonuclease